MSTTYTDLPICELLPHKDPMVLIDRVIDFQEDAIQAMVTIHSHSPFYDKDGVPSYVALEYMAQAIAAWNGLMLRTYHLQPRIGFLLGTRKLSLTVPTFKQGDILHIFGQSKYSDGEMGSFECWIEIHGKQVASATLNVFQPESQGKIHDTFK